MRQRIGVLGGDKRQRSFVGKMIELGREPLYWGLGEEWEAGGVAKRCESWREVVEKAEILVLPLPMSVDNVRIYRPLENSGDGARLSSFFAAARGKRVFAGKVNEAVRLLAEENAVSLIDYYGLEALQMRNAVPTVEGALAIAMQELPVTLYGSEVSVIGYGRIASLLAERLRALGAQVTVYARRERDRLHAELHGMQTGALRLEADGAVDAVWTPHCRVIFNTVPARVLSDHHLQALPADCLVIDLASVPGGVDCPAGEHLGVRCIWATALPGRCFPESAGEILAVTVGELLEEER
jgi:dipicolinate synthase subunit A